MLQLIMLSIVIAIANTYDIITDILAIAIAKISAVELGLFNSLGYLTYIASMYIGSKISDRGIVRTQIVGVLALLVVYNTLLNFFILTANTILLISTYLLCGSAQAFTRTATYAYVHEVYSSSSWRRVLLRRSLVTILCEALMLILVATIGVEALVNNIVYLTLITTLMASFTALIVREPQIKFERTLYRIDLGIRRIEDVVNSISMYALLSSSPSAPFLYNASAKFKLARRMPSLLAIIIALIGFKVANSMTLTPIPVYFSARLGLSLSAILGIYGMARFVPLMSLFWTKSSYKLLSPLFVVRALVPVLMILPGFGANNFIAWVLLGTIYYLNNEIDVNLYSLYIESRGRAETTTYLVCGEVAGLIGTALSGTLYYSLGYKSVILASLLICALSAVLTRT